jgi:hypothetical protein
MARPLRAGLRRQRRNVPAVLSLLSRPRGATIAAMMEALKIGIDAPEPVSGLLLNPPVNAGAKMHRLAGAKIHQ